METKQISDFINFFNSQKNISWVWLDTHIMRRMQKLILPFSTYPIETVQICNTSYLSEIYCRKSHSCRQFCLDNNPNIQANNTEPLQESLSDYAQKRIFFQNRIVKYDQKCRKPVLETVPHSKDIHQIYSRQDNKNKLCKLLLSASIIVMSGFNLSSNLKPPDALSPIIGN